MGRCGPREAEGVAEFEFFCFIIKENIKYLNKQIRLFEWFNESENLEQK